eukprot:tig00021758_g23416.t1
MVRRACSTAPEISDQRSTHASAPSHMYAVAGERILSCGTRLRATLLTEHIHGQTGVQDHEAGAPIPSCVLRTRGREVATAPFQHWLSANDFSGRPSCAPERRSERARRVGPSAPGAEGRGGGAARGQLDVGEIAARITPSRAAPAASPSSSGPARPAPAPPGAGGGPHGRAQARGAGRGGLDRHRAGHPQRRPPRRRPAQAGCTRSAGPRDQRALTPPALTGGSAEAEEAAGPSTASPSSRPAPGPVPSRPAPTAAQVGATALVVPWRPAQPPWLIMTSSVRPAPGQVAETWPDAFRAQARRRFRSKEDAHVFFLAPHLLVERYAEESLRASAAYLWDRDGDGALDRGELEALPVQLRALLPAPAASSGTRRRRRPRQKPWRPSFGTQPTFVARRRFFRLSLPAREDQWPRSGPEPSVPLPTLEADRFHASFTALKAVLPIDTTVAPRSSLPPSLPPSLPTRPLVKEGGRARTYMTARLLATKLVPVAATLPAFFCVNDDLAPDKARALEAPLRAWLAAFFPEPAPFELQAQRG